jgi:hypothetical protein
MTSFAEVKSILDRIKGCYIQPGGGDADWDNVIKKHRINGMPNPFDWQTEEQLLQAVVWRQEIDKQGRLRDVPYPLVDVSGGRKAEKTYLILALSKGFPAITPGARKYSLMPCKTRASKLTKEDIDVITSWIKTR